MKTPTYQQLRILRSINDGAVLRRIPGSVQGKLTIDGAAMAIVQRSTIAKLVAGGWIAPNGKSQTWEITHAGRAEADVKKAVQAFSDNPESR